MTQTIPLAPGDTASVAMLPDGGGMVTITRAEPVAVKPTPKLAPGKSAPFTWPTDPTTVAEVFVDKPAGGAASIRLELVKA